MNWNRCRGQQDNNPRQRCQHIFGLSDCDVKVKVLSRLQLRQPLMTTTMMATSSPKELMLCCWSCCCWFYCFFITMPSAIGRTKSPQSPFLKADWFCLAHGMPHPPRLQFHQAHLYKYTVLVTIHLPPSAAAAEADWGHSWCWHPISSHLTPIVSVFSCEGYLKASTCHASWHGLGKHCRMESWLCLEHPIHYSQGQWHWRTWDINLRAGSETKGQRIIAGRVDEDKGGVERGNEDERKSTDK